MEDDPCSEAYQKSLVNLQRQKTKTWSDTIQETAMWGKTGKIGTGIVEKDDTVYMVQTVEVKNADGTTLRRLSDCMSAKKN